MNVTDTHLPDGPVCTLRDGIVDVEWPKGRPDWFAITPELFEQMTAEINRSRSRRSAWARIRGDR